MDLSNLPLEIQLTLPIIIKKYYLTWISSITLILLQISKDNSVLQIIQQPIIEPFQTTFDFNALQHYLNLLPLTLYTYSFRFSDFIQMEKFIRVFDNKGSHNQFIGQETIHQKRKVLPVDESLNISIFCLNCVAKKINFRYLI